MNEKITYNWRYISIASFFTVFALAIITQMVRIQLLVNTTDLPVTGLLGQWETAASRRGLILDRNGHILAGNQTVYDRFTHIYQYFSAILLYNIRVKRLEATILHSGVMTSLEL